MREPHGARALLRGRPEVIEVATRQLVWKRSKRVLARRYFTRNVFVGESPGTKSVEPKNCIATLHLPEYRGL